jgi:short-subunit dehydrogenase
MSETWIILGASSAMARAFARLVAERGAAVWLAGRDTDDIAALATDCELRGSSDARTFPFDARDRSSFAKLLAAAKDSDSTLNAAVFVGTMPPQAEIDTDPGLIEGTVTDSFTGPATFLQELAPMIEARGAGTVVGVGSVAGDRGRIGNYVYGAAKAGFHTYLSGLRNRLTRSGGHVVTVKPGMIDTAMTWGLDGLVLLAQPEKVASDILRAVDRKKNVIYTPWPWRFIMLIIQHIPEFIFKKMSI